MSQFNTICFTGHRHANSAKVFDSLITHIRYAVTHFGTRNFIVGGAIGFDTLAAEAVLKLRQDEFPDIKLYMAIPFRGFTGKWNASQKQRFASIYRQCDGAHIVAPSFSRRAYQTRNQYMVDRSDLVIAFYNGSSGGTKNCVEYATSKHTPVANIRKRKARG